MEVTLMIVILEEQRRSAARMRALVRWRGADGDAINADECYAKSAKKYKKVLSTPVILL